MKIPGRSDYSPGRNAERGSRASRSAAPENQTAAQYAASKVKSSWKALPDVMELIKPRRGILALGFLLMLINRSAGMILPYSLKPFADNVINKHQYQLLLPLVLALVGATLVQGITSYSLTQLLSKSSQRMITESA